MRVGVSGHRNIDPAASAALRLQLDGVFATLDRTVEELGERYQEYFDPQGPMKRLVSPLAEGADMLAAEVARKRGYMIQAPLPFAASEYAKDFGDEIQPLLREQIAAADSVFELSGQRDGARIEESSYLVAGYLTLRHCDVLIAVWDGKSARGIGGTAMVVEAAVQRGVPVIWVHSEGAQEPCLLRPDLLCGPPVSEIRNILWQTLAPPFVADQSAVEDGFNERARRAANAFRRETERRQNYGLLFQLFQALVAWQAPRQIAPLHKPYARHTDEGWSGFARIIGVHNPDAWHRLSNLLGPRYSWADGLATYYAAVYRTSYVLNYLLGALAVLLALLGLLNPWADAHTGVYLEVVEVLAIAAILVVTIMGRRRRWHERWIDYRQLAEQLRHFRFLYLTGGTSANMTPRHNYDSGSSEGGWVQWYYQATVRELGLAPARATPDYLKAVKELFLDEEISGQISYHQRNAARMHRMEHSLHTVGESLFMLTLAVCATYFTVSLFQDPPRGQAHTNQAGSLPNWVMFLSAFLPALGAAMSGIRVQGEFASTAERSEAMAARLTQLQAEIGADEKIGETGLARLRSFIETTSETMLIEVVDWKFVFRGKPLSLPA
jgi:hypothetical protein